jgi:hypothetical protein
MTRLKFVTCIIATFAAGFGATAQTAETLVEKGASVSFEDRSFDVSFQPEDARYETTAGERGTFQLDGNRVCLEPETDQPSGCIDLPDGKVAGDSFDVVSPTGQTVTITLNE